MKLIPSFQVDHTKLKPGIYVSRRDRVKGGWVTTFDIRMKRPNAEPAIHPNVMHTIEHIVATYLRNSEFKDRVVYFGPMGCMTGCYFLVHTTNAIEPKDIEGLIRAAFRYQAEYEGEIPGARIESCGNFRLHDLAMAKYEASKFLKRSWEFEYPAMRRDKNG